ncbi:MAG: alpha/beta hydrolase [Hyphomicrobiaceae bacterium]
MSDVSPQYLAVGAGSDSRKIAYLTDVGQSPGVLWLSGFKSDMISMKASALAEWCCSQGLSFTRFDYSGHGRSGGRFEDGTVSRWLEEAVAIMETVTTGRQVVVGSSMGGYIALLMLRQLLSTGESAANRIHSLVLIAPAWDMTEALMWDQFPDPVKRTIMDQGYWLRPSQYGEAYLITRNLIEDGRCHLLGPTPWNPGRSVHIIHGQQDSDVPFAHGERLRDLLLGEHAVLTAVPDGEHRLSRPQDLQRIFKTIGQYAYTATD